jgi:beta-glucosidase
MRLGHLEPAVRESESEGVGRRVPIALPEQQAHLPPFQPRARCVTYDLWHGYRRLQRDRHPAAYPFGFGLSYGRFEMAEPHLVQAPATPVGRSS